MGRRRGDRIPHAQIREDLHLIAQHWNLIRMYGAVGNAETVLSVIREDRLPIRVLLGVWLAPEEKRDSVGTLIESFPAIAQGNRAEIGSTPCGSRTPIAICAWESARATRPRCRGRTTAPRRACSSRPSARCAPAPASARHHRR